MQGADAGCPAGRVQRFRDEDLDGVGAGPGQCVEGEAAGFSSVTGDCSPMDPAAWRLAAVELDADDDGVGVPEGTLCVGVVSAPRSETARPAAVVMANPSVAEAPVPGRSWSLPTNASQATGLAATCNGFRQACVPLDCQSFDRWGVGQGPYRGAEVFVRAKVSAPAGALVSARVGMAASAVSPFTEREATWSVSNAYAWHAVGSRDDVWDDLINAPFSDAQQTPLIRVGFSAPDAPNNTNLQVDAIRVRLWPVAGPPDCDDTDPLLSIPATGWVDADVDSYGINPGDGCWPLDLGTYTHRGTDCDDTTADVRPNNPQSFTSPTDAGSFDYDCSGDVTKATFTPSACAGPDAGVDGGCTVVSLGPVSPAAPCGQPFSYDTCNPTTCRVVTRNATVACR